MQTDHAAQPQSIGRYRILRKLGEGGMGIVYAARDELLGRSVAVKTIRGGLPDDRAALRFLREARSAAQLSHPGICQIYEIGEDRGQPYIVMELLEGESLASRLARGPLPLAEAEQCGLATLSALQALHAHNIVHRDLKPSNVFLTPHGPKLLDFGLARSAASPLAETDSGLTLEGAIVGTPSYMSPEQAQGDAVDVRSDLFAVGILLYEMVTARRPFTGASPMAVLHALLYEQPPAITGSAAISVLDRIIHRALAKKPEDRYQSAEAMAEDLRSALLSHDSGESPQAHVVTRLAVLPFRLVRPDPEIEFLAFGLADAITASLSGSESLVVRSSHVAGRYAAEALDPKKIAVEMEVDVVLTGTLLRSAERLGVSTQLIGIPDGRVLWSHASQVTLGDLFELQDHLAQRIAESLPLLAQDRTSSRIDVPRSAKAYELYLRADQFGQESATWQVARDLLQECVRLDPLYAPAWARLGHMHRIIAKYFSDDPGTGISAADTAFRRALEINPELSIAHHLVAQLEIDLGRPEDAMRRLLERVRGRRTDPELFAGLVHACRYCGLLEASIAAHERARRLDPTIRTSILHTYMLTGAYEKIIEERYQSTGLAIGGALAMLGREQEAIASLRMEEERFASHRLWRSAMRGLRLLLEGKVDEAVEAAEVCTAWGRDSEGLYGMARMLARLGRIESALEILDSTVGHGFFPYPGFVRDPWLDPLRARPEFTAILRRAEARHLAARALFAEAGGERALGVRVPV